MATSIRWGTIEPLPFKVTLNGDGVAGLTFQANDIKIMSDGGAWVNASTIGTITDKGNGWYTWTPNSTVNTQKVSLVFNIKDDIGTEFDENGAVFFTGGNVAAFYDGV